MGLAIASKTLALFSEPHVLIGTAVSGAVLILIAILGLVGAIKHHQVILFFVSFYINQRGQGEGGLYYSIIVYKTMVILSHIILNYCSLNYVFQYMIILAISLLLMFSASVAALAVTPTLQERFLISTWIHLNDKDKTLIQDALNCCGFNSNTQNNSANSGYDLHPICKTAALQAPGVRPTVIVLEVTNGGKHHEFTVSILGMLLKRL